MSLHAKVRLETLPDVLAADLSALSLARRLDIVEIYEIE